MLGQFSMPIDTLYAGNCRGSNLKVWIRQEKFCYRLSGNLFGYRRQRESRLILKTINFWNAHWRLRPATS